MIKKFFILFILIFVLSSSIVFASDWDLSFEKELYQNLGNLIMYDNNENYTGYAKREELYTDNFTNNLFNYIENQLENSSYSNNEYKYFVVVFYEKQMAICVTKELNVPTNIIADYLLIRVNFDTDFLITSVDGPGTVLYTYTVNNSSNLENIQAPNTFVLSDIYPTNLNTINNDYIPYYNAFNRHGLTYSSTSISEINKNTATNNNVLNKEYEVGKNFVLNINYYYISNNEKISVNDKISFRYDSYWWGDNYQPYLKLENIKELPIGKYYADYTFLIKNSENNSYTYNTTQEVFRIYETNNDDDTGGTTTPSGDTGEDTPGITTPNYNEKLDNIQTGINNIENKIPTSGDIIQSTTTGVIQGNTSYWGSSGDLTGKEQEETIEEGINNVIDTVSGDLAKNEIFQMLDHYNSQMWGIFTGETDFKIEWSAVNYQNTELISAGSINFTQICKDIEILGYIKSQINIIISFHIILALVEQIYNLILSTLGIDNPYLYEDGNYTEITNVQTGERTEKLYRNRRVYKK